MLSLLFSSEQEPLSITRKSKKNTIRFSARLLLLLDRGCCELRHRRRRTLGKRHLGVHPHQVILEHIPPFDIAKQMSNFLFFLD